MLDDEEERCLTGRAYRDLTEYFEPSYLEIDRIVDVRDEIVEEALPTSDTADAAAAEHGATSTPSADGGATATPGQPVRSTSGSDLPGPPKPSKDLARQSSSDAPGSGPPQHMRPAAPGATLVKRKRRMYLVKWQGLGYAQATWEWHGDVADDTQIARFHRFQIAPTLATVPPAATMDVRPPASEWKRYAESPSYKGGRKLREYQLEGLNWLVFSWYQVRIM